MDSSESELRSQLQACDKQDPAFSALLYDLASLKLQKGEAAEAQELFQEVYELRKDDLGPKATAAGALDVAGAASESDNDWETGDWETGISQLKSANSFCPVAPEDSAAAGCSSRKGGSTGTAAPSKRGGTASQPRGRGQAAYGIEEQDEDADGFSSSARHLPHVVEIYGLNRSITSTDLEAALSDFSWGGMNPNLHWVDDEHALAVFPCGEAAEALLSSTQRQLKVRAYKEASTLALEVPPEALAPPRGARPKTTAVVARRLIGAALGNNQVRDKAGEKELAQMRQDARVGRRQRQQQLAEAWEGD